MKLLSPMVVMMMMMNDDDDDDYTLRSQSLFRKLQIINSYAAKSRKLWPDTYVGFWTKLDNPRISPDTCYVRMTDIMRALTIYGYRMNLLNDNSGYFYKWSACSHSHRGYLSCCRPSRIACTQ